MKIEAELSRRVHVKDRLQVAICEPVEVDDDGDIFGRQRINGTDRIFVRQILLASQASLACIARLEPRLDELQYIINIQCQPYCTFVLFVNKYFIRNNTPKNAYHTRQVQPGLPTVPEWPGSSRN